MLSNIKKIFFWFFGMLFSIFIYVFTYSTNYLIYLKQNSIMLYIIMLFIIFLFYVIGKVSGNISFKKTILNSNTKFIDLKNKYELNKNIILIKKFKKNMNNIYNYIKLNKIPLENISDFSGVDKKYIIRFVHKKDFLRKMKYFYWILGLILSIVIYYFISSLNYFNIGIYSNILIFLISFVALFLFFIEGILISQLPLNYYLKLLDISLEKKEYYKNKVQKNKEIIKKFKNKEQKAIEIIENIISYLNSLNISKKEILSFLEKEGFNKKEAQDILEDSIIKNKKIKTKKNINVSPIKDLFISKMHEEFVSLKETYKKIKDLNLESSKYEKYLADQLQGLKKEVNNKITKEISDSYNNIKDIPDSKDYSIKVLFLYNFLKPYAKDYKKEDIQSFLLSKGYDILLIKDIFDKFKENNIKFLDEDRSFTKRLIYFINNIYFKFSK